MKYLSDKTRLNAATRSSFSNCGRMFRRKSPKYCTVLIADCYRNYCLQTPTRGATVKYPSMDFLRTAITTN